MTVGIPRSSAGARGVALSMDDADGAAASDVAADSEMAAAVPVEAQRRGSWLLGEWPLTLVIAVTGVGLAVIAMHHFRWGSLAIAGGTFGAAVLRMLLPTRRVGLLAVRSRFVDVVTMAGIGIALTVLVLITKT